MRINPPWEKLGGELGFFIPCLDIPRMTEIGRRNAVRLGRTIHATPGIRKGMLGVWFSLLPVPPSAASARRQSRTS